MRALLTVSLLALVAPAANAIPVRYDFTITNVQFQGIPPGAGTADGSGYVVFDTDLAALATGGHLGDAFLPTIDLSFDWLGLHFGPANGSLSEVYFDSSGNPYRWDLDGIVSGGCGFNCVQWGTNDFTIAGTGMPGSLTGGGTALLTQAGVNGVAVGNVSWTQVDIRSVPEPGTLGLLALGMFGAALRRRKALRA